MPNKKPEWLLLLRSGHPLIWVETQEEDRTIRTILATSPGYQVAAWDLVTGLVDLKTQQTTPVPDPRRAIEALNTMPEGSVLVVKDGHRMAKELPVYRTIKNNLKAWKATDRHLVLLAIDRNIPKELMDETRLYEVALPTPEELVALAEALARANATEEDKEGIRISPGVGQAGAGLTYQQAEDAICLSLLMHGDVRAEVLANAKLEAIRKSSTLELYEPVPLDNLGGLDALKAYLLARRPAFEHPNEYPPLRGILLVGAPGCGKSLSAKVAANILRTPLIRLDMAALKGSLVGESEARQREAFRLIDAVAGQTGIVLWIDEIDKFMSSAQTRSESATPNMLSTLFTWMQETTSRKYIVATCNEIEPLVEVSQGALLRRFDDVFYVSLPSAVERAEIIKIMTRRYPRAAEALASVDPARLEGWSGAEIEKLAINCIYENVDEALRNIHPVSIAAANTIQKMEQWAKQNARPASSPLLANETQQGKRIRAIKEV